MTASCRVALPSTAVHAVQHSALPIGADDDEDDATLFVKHLELANWAELVDGTADRDMLLYFFAPWCGHCRSERAGMPMLDMCHSLPRPLPFERYCSVGAT